MIPHQNSMEYILQRIRTGSRRIFPSFCFMYDILIWCITTKSSMCRMIYSIELEKYVIALSSTTLCIQIGERQRRKLFKPFFFVFYRKSSHFIHANKEHNRKKRRWGLENKHTICVIKYVDKSICALLWLYKKEAKSDDLSHII